MAMEQLRSKFLQLSNDYDYCSINWFEYYSHPERVLPEPLGTSRPTTTEQRHYMNTSSDTTTRFSTGNRRSSSSSHTPPSGRTSSSIRRNIMEDDEDDALMGTPVSHEKKNVSRYSTPNEACSDDDDDEEAEYVFGQETDTSVSKTRNSPRVQIVSDDEEEEEEYDKNNIESEEYSDDGYDDDEEDEITDEPTSHVLSDDDEEAGSVTHNKKSTATAITELTPRQFAQQRDQLLLKYYEEFNRTIFHNKLPSMKLTPISKQKNTNKPMLDAQDVEEVTSNLPEPYIKWNKTLRKTAGITKMFRKVNSDQVSVAIEISVKVCDGVDRLRKTLAHEMCHVATFWLHRIRGHGNCFFQYGKLVTSKYPQIPVTTCHSYAIQYKYHYQCKNCGTVVKRHSKSLKTETFSCKMCARSGMYHQIPTSSNHASETRAPSQYNLYVKQNYQRLKNQYPQQNHRQIMKLLGEQYKNCPPVISSNSTSTCPVTILD